MSRFHDAPGIWNHYRTSGIPYTFRSQTFISVCPTCARIYACKCLSTTSKFVPTDSCIVRLPLRFILSHSLIELSLPYLGFELHLLKDILAGQEALFPMWGRYGDDYRWLAYGYRTQSMVYRTLNERWYSLSRRRVRGMTNMLTRVVEYARHSLDRQSTIGLIV